VILLVALVRKNKVAARHEVTPYAVSLAAVGAVISLYHYLLEWNPTWESNVCAIDVPCTTIWFRSFGFVSLPFMALCGFVSVVILLCATYTKNRDVSETAEQQEKL
jgi:disulfide bond formation protein DsbB